MFEKRIRIRRTYNITRGLHLRIPWKVLLYLACGVTVVKIIKDISITGERTWSQEKWNSKHRKGQVHRIVGGTGFVPGKFLENARPTPNRSHCDERWTTIANPLEDNATTGSPELGLDGPFRVAYDVIRSYGTNEHYKFEKQSEYGCVNKVGVTYVTHATPEYLYHIAELLGRWEGPISVAVYAPGLDASLARYVLTRLCHCLLPQQASRLSVHLIYHVKHPPVLNGDSKEVIGEEPGGSSKCGPPSVLGNPTYRTKMSLAYPVNVARNAARAGARTPHILVSDVELLPSMGMATQFCSMLARANKRQESRIGGHKDWTGENDVRIPVQIPLPQPTVLSSAGNFGGGIRRLAFVVPVFEVEMGEKVPETKEQLLSLMAKDRAFYFHRWQCVHCQKFPGIHLWMEEKKGVTGNLQPLVMVRREFPYHRWEPIYIGTNREPLYSEVLMWEGQQDKMTQMHQMCLLGYRFVILDRAFLVHTPGVKRPLPHRTVKGQPIKVELDPEAEQQKEWLRSHEKRNTQLYEMIVESMNVAHPRNPKCKAH